MSTAQPPMLCPVCSTQLGTDGTCPRCQAVEGWQEQLDGVDFIIRRFETARLEGAVSEAHAQALITHYKALREDLVKQSQTGIAPGSTPLPAREVCWSCKSILLGRPQYCPDCGAPVSGPAVTSLRFYRYFIRELERIGDQGKLPLWQVHDLLNSARGAVRALKQRLEDQRAPVVKLPPGDESPREPTEPAGPRRSLLELMLDPRSIGWLLASGAGLLALGLVVWLSSLGIFKDPVVVAVALGLGNAALVGAGWALVRLTRYQFAGRALTLLACLVMPLNLWFYHSQGLVTLAGHLWVPATVCCVIYAASALVLRDPLFVYALVGGVTLTGLLLLGDRQLDRLQEITAPVTLLVGLGLVFLHAERAFPDNDDAFSRRRFGMAFFWSAQAVLGAGLLLLLGAQLLSWLYEPFFQNLGVDRPDVGRREYLLWPLLLTLAATYAYLYSDFVVRRVGIYIVFAAITLLWSEVQLLALLDLAGHEPIVILSTALTALAVNVLLAQFAERPGYLRVVPPLGLLLSTLPVALGVILHFRSAGRILQQIWPHTIDAGYVAAMIVTALSCRVSAFLYRKSSTTLSAAYFFLTAAATLVAAAGLAVLLGFTTWETQAPLLMLIPIAYLIASSLYRGGPSEQPLLWSAYASAAVMVLSSVWAALDVAVEGVRPLSGSTSNLLLMAFALEAALFFALVAGLRRIGASVYLTTLMVAAALWQFLLYLETPAEGYTIAFAGLGLVMLIVYRLALLERSTTWRHLALAGFRSANTLTMLGLVAGALLGLSRGALLEGELANLDAGGDWHGPVRLALYLSIAFGLLGLVAAGLVQEPPWRRAYLVLALVHAALVVVLFHRLSLLSPWQKLEIVTSALGVVLLCVGYVGWYRENQDHASDVVGLTLTFGSLCLVIPLAVATVVHRFGSAISAVDECLLVFACVALFGSGVLCRLKATTLVGASTMVLYLLMVLIYMNRFLEQQVLVGIYLTLGGALLFGTGLVLSVYRDRLLTLPDRIKRREGIFKVLGWR